MSSYGDYDKTLRIVLETDEQRTMREILDLLEPDPWYIQDNEPEWEEKDENY